MLNEEKKKVCTGCNVEKLYQDFYVDKRHKTGRTSRCAECNLQGVKSRYVRKRPISVPRTHAEQIAHKREYGRQNYLKNRERLLQKSHETYLRNKEKVNDRAAAWKKANPAKQAAYMARRRAKPESGDLISGSDVVALLKMQRGLCVVCRCDITLAYNLDHIVPLKLGGGNERTNFGSPDSRVEPMRCDRDSF